MARPLEGVRILDLTRLLPGPWATLMLADLGAEVIKVEDPQDGGDFVRWLPPVIPGNDGEQVSALFLALNRNKKSLALDLKKGRDVFLRLVTKADVVIEGFRPGVLERLGIGWSTLSEKNPRLVVCSMSGWGQEGPYSQRAGHDLNYIALAGLLGIAGPKDGPPAIPGAPVSDLGASLIAVSSVLAALLARDKNGKGAFLDVSMYDAALALMIPHLPGALAGAPLARGEIALTGRDPNYRVYRTKDGRWISVGNLEPKFWSRFVQAIQRDDLNDRALAAQVDPAERAKLHATLEALFAGKTLAEWTEILAPADCCIEPVLEGDEVLSHPQARAREPLLEQSGAKLPRTPIRPWSHQVEPTPAPKVGEHTDAVLSSLGFAKQEIAALRAQGIVR